MDIDEKPPSTWPARAKPAAGFLTRSGHFEAAGTLTVMLALSVWAHTVAAGRSSRGASDAHLDAETRTSRTPSDVSAARLPDTGGLSRADFWRPLPEIGRQAVARWIDELESTHPVVLRRYLDLVRTRESQIRPVLVRSGVPSDFVYLALLESRMNPDAYSRNHAVGLWQFRSRTARAYGLTVSRQVDERRHPAPSTRAAARYLKDLHARFGTWELAAAAYNLGPTRLARTMERTGATTFWELYEHRAVPRETRNYVPKLMAVARLDRRLRRSRSTGLDRQVRPGDAVALPRPAGAHPSRPRLAPRGRGARQMTRVAYSPSRSAARDTRHGFHGSR